MNSRLYDLFSSKIQETAHTWEAKIQHAPGDRIQKSEKETQPLLPRPPNSQYPAGSYSRSRENIYIETEREDGGPVWNYSTKTKNV